ncbi:CDP-alcohol phosphatidyltransferase family protein [Dactylosporangium sp. NPDC051541]|uniref:CDP-alcohol phosphatidyltransferase family protein n=1 Tax=Dactylosporangium sp. NPDC051541 TaxID=3363977 RepID=UPI0037B39701
MRGPDALDWDGYCARWSAAHGGYDPRTAPSLVRGWLRLGHTLGAALLRAGVGSPNTVTSFGLLFSLGVPPVAALAPLGALWAAILILLAAFADTIDGVLAVIADRATRLGQVYDSAADRLSEAAWLVAFALLGAPVWLTVAAGGTMWLHEYVRARATVAGLPDIGTVTIAERPTRILIAIFGLLATLLDTRAAAVTMVMALLVALIGLGQLLRAVVKALR